MERKNVILITRMEKMSTWHLERNKDQKEETMRWKDMREKSFEKEEGWLRLRKGPNNDEEEIGAVLRTRREKARRKNIKSNEG